MVKDTKLVEFLYSNILINNNTNQAVAAFYNETQDLPILSNQQDFQLRVVRLKVPMNTVPLFLYKPETYYISFGLSQPFTDDTIDKAKCDNTVYNILPPVEVEFCPDVDRFSVPVVSADQYLNSVHNYESFLAQINHALSKLWDTAWSGSTETLLYQEMLENIYGTTKPFAPYFRIDDCSNCFQFCWPQGAPTQNKFSTNPFFPSLGISNTGTEDIYYGIKILMSAPLHSLLNGFQSFYFGPTGVEDLLTKQVYPNLNFALYFDVFPNNLKEFLPVDFDDPGLWWVKTQEQSSLYAWQTASRIIITTNISLVKESVLIGVNAGKPVRLEVLTDFTIPQTGIDSVNEYLYYDNIDNDRWINLVDMGALNRMDLKVFVQFSDLSLMPLIIAPNHEFNIKLGFRRKLANASFQNSSMPYNISGHTIIKNAQK